MVEKVQQFCDGGSDSERWGMKEFYEDPTIWLRTGFLVPQFCRHHLKNI